jgi:hypothetical protein
MLHRAAPCMQRVSGAPVRLRQHLSPTPLARTKADSGPARYLIVTSAQQQEIGRVQIKVSDVMQPHLLPK